MQNKIKGRRGREFITPRARKLGKIRKAISKA